MSLMKTGDEPKEVPTAPEPAPVPPQVPTAPVRHTLNPKAELSHLEHAAALIKMGGVDYMEAWKKANAGPPDLPPETFDEIKDSKGVTIRPGDYMAHEHAGDLPGWSEAYSGWVQTIESSTGSCNGKLCVTLIDRNATSRAALVEHVKKISNRTGATPGESVAAAKLRAIQRKRRENKK